MNEAETRAELIDPALKEAGYSHTAIAKKTDLNVSYVKGIIRLLKKGEDRLLRAVDKGDIEDALDEFNAMIFEAAPLDHPIWNMFSAHMDELWEALPPPSGN